MYINKYYVYYLCEFYVIIFFCFPQKIIIKQSLLILNKIISCKFIPKKKHCTKANIQTFLQFYDYFHFERSIAQIFRIKNVCKKGFYRFRRNCEGILRDFMVIVKSVFSFMLLFCLLTFCDGLL
jgi:hypothetical protein